MGRDYLLKEITRVVILLAAALLFTASALAGCGVIGDPGQGPSGTASPQDRGTPPAEGDEEEDDEGDEEEDDEAEEEEEGGGPPEDRGGPPEDRGGPPEDRGGPPED